MNRNALAVAILSALAFPLVASAQVAADEASDIDCLAASLIISQNPEAMRSEGAMASVMYFLGKLTVREADYAMPLATTMREMTNVMLEETANRCDAELEFVGNDMQRRGAELEAAEETQP